MYFPWEQPNLIMEGDEGWMWEEAWEVGQCECVCVYTVFKCV